MFGIRADHTWRTLVFPLLLTSLVHSGSLALEFWLVISGRRGLKSFGEWMYGMLHNVMAWRNYIVEQQRRLRRWHLQRVHPRPRQQEEELRLSLLEFIGMNGFIVRWREAGEKLWVWRRNGLVFGCEREEERRHSSGAALLLVGGVKRGGRSGGEKRRGGWSGVGG
ncbi:uncharacterized protein A4U43_C05F18120 [Asparagus officinalis]|uniref:Uncharacterized protein n=1 Tax=Asparagus officinalis TaxID=4686 RepID=A0A5P1EWC9_ASPOF|nr:uncharacterized protein A4U43_C05F18120 [Asparagus officinalis]